MLLSLFERRELLDLRVLSRLSRFHVFFLVYLPFVADCVLSSKSNSGFSTPTLDLTFLSPTVADTQVPV